MDRNVKAAWDNFIDLLARASTEEWDHYHAEMARFINSTSLTLRVKEYAK